MKKLIAVLVLGLAVLCAGNVFASDEVKVEKKATTTATTTTAPVVVEKNAK